LFYYRYDKSQIGFDKFFQSLLISRSYFFCQFNLLKYINQFYFPYFLKIFIKGCILAIGNIFGYFESSHYKAFEK